MFLMDIQVHQKVDLEKMDSDGKNIIYSECNVLPSTFEIR